MPAVPKKKHSRAKSVRRSSIFSHRPIGRVTAKSRCPHCGAAKIPQRVCASCGQYKGREIFPESK